MEDFPAGTERSLAELSAPARQRLGRLWQMRAEHEQVAGSVFGQLVVELRAFLAPASVIALAERAVLDERRHAELCCALAELYAGAPQTLQLAPEPPLPSFPVCDPRVHRALFAALHCAVNETLAVPYLAACVEQAQCPAAKAVVRELLSDEVMHARIGWAVLGDPRLTADDRATIGSFMPALLDVCVGSWLRDNDVDFAEDLPRGHGFVSQGDIRATITEAIGGLLLPGLEHVGIPTERARRWEATLASRADSRSS